MLVVFGHPLDTGARSLVHRWADHGAALLTCDDLSIAGWRHTLDGGPGSRAVISGQVVNTREIQGVLTRWPAVFPQDLRQIAPEDREYVSAEMTAFLRSWLTRLPCLVANRPDATSLAGPSWRPEQWVHTAARLGIPVRPIRRRTGGSDAAPPAPEGGFTTLTVIGERCFGEADPVLQARARRLAAAAGATLLEAHFSGAELVSANPLPRLEEEDRAGAALSLLLGGREAA